MPHATCRQTPCQILSPRDALLALLFSDRRLRKYPFSRSEKIAWRFLMLLMGPGALLALYALYDWPAKEPCPACGKMRVVNRENCEFCGAPFTPPAPTGKEIFEKDEAGRMKCEG